MKNNADGFLPTSAKEVASLGWEWLDVILFSGDAYVDHPSFGMAVIGRTLQAAGYRVAIVPQPNWQDDLRDFRKFGAPRLFFGVTAGAMDSTVNHYTATLRLRSNDAYTPDERAGARPDYPTIVYTKILKQLYPDSMVVVGGIEASLRRVTHYDYLQNRLRPSFLVESGADCLIYGMGEKAVVAIAEAIETKREWRDTPQIAYFSTQNPDECILLHSFEECEKSPRKFGENFVKVETESNRTVASTLVEPYKDGAVIVNPPYPTFSTEDCDATYALPYMRSPAPRYKDKKITAWEMIKHSVNIHRGCFGGCSFCAISMHQGKYIASRSENSIFREIENITAMADFRGTLTDVGGPSANMWRMGGKNRELCVKCSRASCLFPKICVNLGHDHAPLLKLYDNIRKIPRVKHAFVSSGIRYDMFDTPLYLRQVLKHHTSGRLKVAPEHTEPAVLKLMRKPSWDNFIRLKAEFDAVCKVEGLPCQIIPYFISSHPGCEDRHMMALREKTVGVRTEQVQDFTPTPMTLSSVIYYTGTDPYTGEKVFVAKGKANKDKQKSYFFDKHKNGRKESRGAEKSTGTSHQKRHFKRS